MELLMGDFRKEKNHLSLNFEFCGINNDFIIKCQHASKVFLYPLSLESISGERFAV